MRRMRRAWTVVVGGAAAAALFAISAPRSAAVSGVKRVVERASVSVTGTQATGGDATGPLALSADGRFVVFRSAATNLVPNDTNDTTDVFVRDRLNGNTERVSVASDGTQANGFSDFGHISADGRFVVFRSDATNLVPGDTNAVGDIFVRDRQGNTTTRVSLSSAGAQANNASSAPKISADGSFVVFQSVATNLVTGDTNGNTDIFVRGLQPGGSTERVSLTSAGAQSTGGDSVDPWISADGSAVAFTSSATNLVANDTNGVADIFVRAAGTTERASVSSTGTQATGASSTAQITPDARFVLFQSTATNLVTGDTNGASDVFLRDRVTGATVRVSVNSDGVAGNGSSFNAAISADGNVVAFMSEATNLVPSIPFNTNAIYRHSRLSGETTRVNVSATGEAPNSLNNFCAISGDGRFVAFASLASNLVPQDTNGAQDIFVASVAIVPGTRLAIFRPATREWFARDDDGSTSSVAFGGPGDVPVPADYLGLGRAQVAIYRPSTAQWFLRTEEGGTLGPFDFGNTRETTIPVPGDYLGTGRAQIAAYLPGRGVWGVRGEDGEEVVVTLGTAGDVPVPADYLGLGKLQQAVFRPSTRQWFIADPTTGGTVVVEYGGPGDVPVPGDYFGIGRASIAIFRPGTGEWYLRHDNGQTTRIPFGAAGDTPVPGDYLELGRDQIAVFRPSTRSWLIRENPFATTRIDFGGPGDQPIPVPFRPRF
jgi:putative transposon-encoded protein